MVQIAGDNVQAALHVMADAMRRDDWSRIEHTPPTIVQLMEMLKPAVEEDPGAKVYIFGEICLDGDIRSYRGYYDHLALGYCLDQWDNEDAITVKNLRDQLKNAVGKNYEGYKGGTFTMGPHTPVWIANYGQTYGSVIVNVQEPRYGRCYLDVKQVEGL